MLGLGAHRLRAVAFDIIGTVFPLEPLRPELIRLGFPASGLEGWFAAGLRDAFALAAAGDFEPFPLVLEEALKMVAAEQGLQVSADERTRLVERISELAPRPEARAAFEQLAAARVPVLAVSNGSASTTQKLLKAAGLDHLTKHVVSVDEVKLSKPRPEVYLHAVKTAGVRAGELALVAAHPWDVNGAKAAGLITAYLNADRPFSAAMREPDVEGATLTEIATALLNR